MRMLELKIICPYEIGKRVQLKEGGELKVMEITDIFIRISTKTGYVKFILELDGWYKLDTDLYGTDSPRVQ